MDQAIAIQRTELVPQGGVRAALTIAAFLALSIAITGAIPRIFGFSSDTGDTLYTSSYGTTVQLATGSSQSATVPTVEPVLLNPMTPDDARQINFAVPFVDGPNPAARPFKLVGSAADRERAKTCLASAAWYEAGPDKEGQQAVVQVVLNRLRHPAFPKTVCGVVFQGAERSTGCQFTFSCDGSMVRVPSGDAWQNARRVADKALSGFVFKQVGTATHYHTDWVVPYWRDSLDKLTAVHSQIFYRWRGWWGTPSAFAGVYQGGEVMDQRLETLADRNLLGPLPPVVAEMPPSPVGSPKVALAVEGVSQEQLKGTIVRLMDASAGQYAIELDPSAFAGSYAVAALNICAAKQACSVMGWTDPNYVPKAFPVSGASMQHVSFVYKKDKATGAEQIYWNCEQIQRANKAQCLPSSTVAETAQSHEAS
jgi:spore germination cell wall hydrolase CwlJ-like protein